MTANENTKPADPIEFTPSGRLIDADHLVLLLRGLATATDKTRDLIPRDATPELAYTIELNNFGRTVTAEAYRGLASMIELSRVVIPREIREGQVATSMFASVPTIPSTAPKAGQ